MIFLILFLAILLLILLITWAKLNAFIAFLIVSVTAGLALGLPADKVISSVEKGLGDTLGSLVIIVVLGAMLGKLVAESGAAQTIAATLMRTFGMRYVQWAVMITGFIIGISLFYGVGFVLMVPLVFSICYMYNLPAVYIGISMLASLSVTHGFLPPHPSPVALAAQFHADLGLTLIYGLIIAIPAVIIAGPLFGRVVKNVHAQPLETFRPKQIDADKLPGLTNSFITALLPVFLLIIATVLQSINIYNDATAKKWIDFFGNPSMVMLISVMAACFTLGNKKERGIAEIMRIYGDAVKDIGIILLIIAGAGALKQVLTDSGVSNQIAATLQSWPLHPLLLAWLIAAVIRVCIGSATIAGLTAAGIVAPIVTASNVHPELMVLSVGAGSLFFSHVNDSGFWLFKEYFNVSMKDTFKTWSMMETIISLTGLVGVLVMNQLLN